MRLSDIAREVGTPVYVYSRALIEENFQRFDAAFAPVPHVVCYAAKANSNLSVLECLARLGSGADVVSGGELRAVLDRGFRSDRVVFSGVGKTDEEIRYGVSAGILALNVESEPELRKVNAAALEAGVVARVALRVNPDIDARSHPYISTGRRHNKFGVDIRAARALFEAARSLPGVRMTGVQAHIGSQILDVEPLAEAARELAALALSLREAGFPIETLDIGGGLGISGDGERGATPEEYASAVLPHLRGLPFKILIEPGRAIVGPAGVLITRVLYLKDTSEKHFVITDAGMNDLLRPALYDAIHRIESVKPRAGSLTADIVGPVCESSDFFARDREIDAVKEGDWLAIRDTGAYGLAMSSNYNFRPRAAEVLVEGDTYRVVRRRETYEDLTRLEG